MCTFLPGIHIARYSYEYVRSISYEYVRDVDVISPQPAASSMKRYIPAGGGGGSPFQKSKTKPQKKKWSSENKASTVVQTVRTIPIPNYTFSSPLNPPFILLGEIMYVTIIARNESTNGIVARNGPTNRIARNGSTKI